MENLSHGYLQLAVLDDFLVAQGGPGNRSYIDWYG